jgi:hypothetical protein
VKVCWPVIKEYVKVCGSVTGGDVNVCGAVNCAVLCVKFVESSSAANEVVAVRLETFRRFTSGLQPSFSTKYTMEC